MVTILNKEIPNELNTSYFIGRKHRRNRGTNARGNNRLV
jgi:hypothetical protein